MIKWYYHNYNDVQTYQNWFVYVNTTNDPYNDQWHIAFTYYNGLNNLSQTIPGTSMELFIYTANAIFQLHKT